MVSNVFSVSGRGLRDWIWQRLSAVILLVYTLFLVLWSVLHQPLNFEIWRALFTALPMKIATSLCVLSLVLHAWIGVWTIVTDYIACYGLRIVAHSAVIIALASYWLWGNAIVWSL